MPASHPHLAPARGTAWTITGFLVATVALSAAPGVPDDLRPLQLHTSEQRLAIAKRVFAKPKMTLAEHEKRLEGHVDEDDAAPDAEDVALHDESMAADDLVALSAPSPLAGPRPTHEARVAVTVDRAAVVARAASAKSKRLQGQHAGLKMPGSAIDNPCIVDDGAGGCRQTALDAFFSTLDAVARGDHDARAQVMVLGNSLLASDHVTDIVRARLSEAFGDAGRGFLLPERLVKGVGRRVRTGQGSDGWLVRNFAQDPPFAPGIRFGFSGAVYEATGDSDWTRWNADNATTARLFWLDTGKAMTLEADGKVWLQVPAGEATNEAKDAEVRLPPLTKTVKLVAATGARVFGIALERERRGVIVDTVGVPAASTKLYTQDVDADIFNAQVKARAPTLAVIMLGGNETRGLAFGTVDDATFEARLTTLVDNLKSAAPTASCLIVSPIDAGKTTTSDDTLITREEIHRVIAIQKKVAAATGCGMFDIFAAMGGAGSLQRMREQHLVSDDLVHPTSRGGDVLGQLFADALLNAYRDTPPQGENLAHRRHTEDAGLPQFAGLSFPKEEAVPVVLGQAAPAPKPQPLSRFFDDLAALERGERGRVAIGQFGASHTAGQTLTDRMRARLAARYGGAGRGFVAVGGTSKRLKPSGVVRDIVGAFDIADGREMVSGGALGMSGTKARLLPGARFKVGFCQSCPAQLRPSAKATVEDSGTIELAWLYTPDMGTADVLINGERRATLTASTRRRESDVQFLRLPVDNERAVLEVVTRATPQPWTSGDDHLSPVGPVHLLGVVEEMDRPGIVLDAIGLPGTTGMTPQRWRQDLYGEEVRSRRYDLIVTAWGTNEVGISSLDAATYRHHFGNTLRTLQAAAPEADCLIIGASDRLDDKGQGWVSAPRHELVERVQKELAAEHGCAFFSMRDAMGGPGSMKRWVAEGLALPDHVHFTAKGYQRLADILIDDLFAAARWQREGKGGADGADGTGGANADAPPPADAGTGTDNDDILDDNATEVGPVDMKAVQAIKGGTTASITTTTEVLRAVP